MVPAWYFILRKGHEWSPVEKQLSQFAVMSVAAFGLFGLGTYLTGAAPAQVLPLWVVLVALVSGSSAIIFRGTFYLLPGLCALSAVVIAMAPSIGLSSFGTAYAIGVNVPAWKNTRSGRTPTPLETLDKSAQKGGNTQIFDGRPFKVTFCPRSRFHERSHAHP